MTPEQANTLQDLLTQACESHLNNGGRIIAGSFAIGEDHTKVCPIMALLGTIGGGISDKLSEIAGFPITPEEMWDLIYAFDNQPKHMEYLQISGQYSQVAGEIGQKLRALYIEKE